MEGVIDAASGLTAFFISRTDLIASKLAAGRMRDLANVEDMRNAEAGEAERGQVKPSSDFTDGGLSG